MIVVRAEIWPFGDADQAYEIGIIFAWNEGIDSPLSSYAGTVSQEGYEIAGVQRWSRDFQIHSQDRSDGPWRLVAAILAEIATR